MTDAAGNVLSSTDARGITASFAYDALNRLTGITYPTAGEDVTYGHDTCANGIGRLCSVTDPTGTRTYAYDGLGRTASVTWTTSNQVFTTSYSWTPADKLASITYPSGRLVSYTSNSLGHISAIATGGQNIVTGRTYRADGLLTGQTYGNGLVDMRRVEALGPITAALAQHRIESLEQLNAILQQSKQPLGTSFTADEIASVTEFLANLESEGFAVNKDSGEIFNRSGRRNAGPGFIHALRKIATSGN